MNLYSLVQQSFVAISCCIFLCNANIRSSDAQANDNLHLVALRISKGGKSDVLRSRKLFLLDSKGNDLSKKLRGEKSKCQTDENGSFSINTPKGRTYYVVPDFDPEAKSYGLMNDDDAIPTLSRFSVADLKQQDRSIICRSLDCCSSQDAIWELKAIYKLIENNVSSSDIMEFRKNIKAAISKLEERKDSLSKQSVQTEKVNIKISAFLAGGTTNFFVSESKRPSSIDWMILDAWNGVVKQGTSADIKQGVLPVELREGSLYAVFICPKDRTKDAEIPPTYTWICPTSGDPLDPKRAQTKYDEKVAVQLVPLAELNQEVFKTVLLQMRNMILPAAEAEANEGRPIFSILSQIDSFITRLDQNAPFADLRDTPGPVDVLVHLVKSGPEQDTSWSTLRGTALGATNVSTKYWAVCDTTTPGAFAKLLADEAAGGNLGRSRFQILGYMSVQRAIGNSQNRVYSERELMDEARLWMATGARGVLIDFYDHSKMSNLGALLKQNGMEVFAHIRDQVDDDTVFSNNPWVDKFIISRGTSPDYAKIRDLTLRQLLPKDDPNRISELKVFGAVDRVDQDYTATLKEMIEARCSIVSIGSSAMERDANGNMVFFDQRQMVPFWQAFVRDVENWNRSSRAIRNRMKRENMLSIPIPR